MCRMTVMSEPKRVVDVVIERFGGVSKLADALGHKHPSTVSEWRRRKSGNIPAEHQKAVLAAARDRGIELTADDLLGDAPSEAAA